jgi:16S rRNA processing protein RimM
MSSAPQVYKVRDLAGCEVFAETGESLGILVDVLPSGGNDIFVVRAGEKEILIPALKQVVKFIDLTARRIEVELPKGLRDVYGK